MQTLRAVLALLSAGILAALVVLTVAAPAASRQMAAKQQMAAQFRQNMAQCDALPSAAAVICERRAYALADMASAMLDRRCQRMPPHWPPLQAWEAQPAPEVLEALEPLGVQAGMRCNRLPDLAWQRAPDSGSWEFRGFAPSAPAEAGQGRTVSAAPALERS